MGKYESFYPDRAEEVGRCLKHVYEMFRKQSEWSSWALLMFRISAALLLGMEVCFLA